MLLNLHNMTHWKEYKFSDFVEINPKVSLKKGIEYSFVEMKDLTEGNKFVTPSQKRALTGGSRFENGDTLFARITPCLENGKICQVQNLENGIGFGSTEFLVFRGKKGVSDSNFVHYLSLSDVVRGFAEQNMVGTSGRQRVSWQVFENLVLKLPDLPTQTAIAEILSSLDDKIELNNKINQELENLAQTLFKRWFIDFEFPNKNGEPYKSSGGEMVESELGEIPKGWGISTIGDWGQIVCGKTPSKSNKEYYGKDVLFIKIPDMHNNVFVIKTEDGLSTLGANSQKNKLLRKGTVILSSIATVGLVSIVSKDSQTNQQINAVIPKNRIYTYFLYLMLKTKTDDFKQLASGGSATLNMNTSTFKAYKLLMPSELLLIQFDEFANDLFDKIYQQSLEIEELTHLRDTLLPKLISGELEVSQITKEKE